MSNLNMNDIYQKINAVDPIWTDLVQLKQVYPEQQYLLLHAGPAFHNFQEIPAAVKNSLLMAVLFEGWASNKQEALAFIQQDHVKILPAQDFDVLVPLAGVISPSMFLIQIENAKNAEEKTYAVLNEGMKWCTRLGIYDENMLSHLIWLHRDFSHWLKQIIAKQPIYLSGILQQSLAQGDDGHGRTIAGSKLLADAIVSLAGEENVPQEMQAFLYESLAFALNFWMAAALLIIKSGAESKHKPLIVKAGGNGLRFGYALSTDPMHWISVTAPTIEGQKESAYLNEQALGTIGDSAVVDILGLGGQVLDIAEVSAKNLINYLPADYQSRMHDFSLMPLTFLGNRHGLVDLDKVQQNQKAPLILLGMIDQSGQYGRIGGGVATLTSDVFQA